MRIRSAVATILLLLAPCQSVFAEPVRHPNAVDRLDRVSLVVRGVVTEKTPGDKIPLDDVPGVAAMWSTEKKLGDVATIAVREVLKGELDRDTIHVRDIRRNIETPGVHVEEGQHVLLFLNKTDGRYAYAVGEDGAVDLDASPRWIPMAGATLSLLDDDKADDPQARAYLLAQLRQFERLTAEEQRFALSVLIGRPGEPGELIDAPPALVMSVLDNARTAESVEVRRQAVTTAAALHRAAPDERKSDLLPYLADALDDDDVQVRMGAIRALQWIRDGELTDEGRRGYDPYAEPRNQREAVARWREWVRGRAEQ